MDGKIINNRIKDSTGDRIFNAVCYTLATMLMLIVLYPLIYIVSASFSEPDLVISGDVWLWPVQITLNGYVKVFENKGVMSGYANTVFYTVTGTAINLAFTLPAGYALSKKTMPGVSILTIFVMIPMYFSGGMIPTYLWIRDLGLLDTRTVMIVGGAVSIWNLILARTFFTTFSAELEEAAIIDGCSTSRLFLTIVLPLSKALVSVLLLYYAVAHWNSYFNAMLYINDQSKHPLQLWLRRILIMNDNSAMNTDMLDAERMYRAQQLRVQLRFAVIIVTSLPVLTLYPFIQKYFDKGVMLGSLKG